MSCKRVLTRGLGCLTAGLLLAGCAGGSPFAGPAPLRSPYERYDTLRGNTRPATTVDSFGRERPALRERLAPLDPV